MGSNIFYVFVDKKNKKILDLIQKLPQDWKNVNGLNLHSESELMDLVWAGHENCAWISFNNFDFTGYESVDNWFEISKNNIKSEFENQSEKQLKEVLSWNDSYFIFDSTFKSNLSFILSLSTDSSSTHTFNFINGDRVLTRNELLDLASNSNEYIESVISVKQNIMQLIDSCSSIQELQLLDFNVNWPSTNIS